MQNLTSAHDTLLEGSPAPGVGALNTLSARTRLIIGLLGVAVFSLVAIYYATAADGHPRVKHTLLFAGLALLSALFAWFSLPPRDG